MYKPSLKENSVHGTPLFPLHIYSKVRDRDYHVGYHWHEELEFILVEDGVMEVTVNSELIRVTKGNFILINSGDLHQITSTGPSTHHAIVFHPKILNFEYPDASQHGIIAPITKGLLRFPSSIPCDLSLKNEVTEKLLQIIALNQTESEWSALRIKIMLLEIISAHYEKQLMLKTQANAKEKQENIKKVITYIKKHYDKQIFLEDLAALLGMNKNYFSKYFSEAIGKTPITYINEYRCEKAAELLKNTELKVLEISLMVGFDNFSYFIRRFKEYKRYSPAQYRRLMRE